MSIKRSWSEWFNDLKIYKQINGNCLVPQNYVTKEGFKLGRWVSSQRSKVGSMGLEEKSLLNGLGFVWYAKPKYSYEEVSNFISGFGYTLLSDEFKSIKYKIKIKCDKGHVYSAYFSVFRKGHRCGKCMGNVKYTYNEVEEMFKDRGYKLLSECYVGNKQKLNFVCDRGHKGSIKLNSFIVGHGCWKCSQEDKAKDFTEVVKTFESVNLELLENRYNNCKEYLKYRCKKCGHVGRKSYNMVQQGYGCVNCGSGPVSEISKGWLLQFGNVLTEYSIKNLGIRVDGFDPETNTVYEFLGDYWHGNPEVYNPEEINQHNKKTFGQLYKETKERISMLKENGYNVVYIWEKDFRRV